MKRLKIRITLLEEILGTASSNPNIHDEFIASNAPDAPSREEEVAALGAEAVAEKGRTVFPRDKDGNPILWDYQVRGFFKDACAMLKAVPGTKSSKLKAYKKEIDGRVFVEPRQIRIETAGPITTCQRPLRAQTLQGDRVALASSEAIPAGSTLTCTVLTLIDDTMDLVKEWLDYGRLRGLGQWRNSGKGKFEWELISED